MTRTKQCKTAYIIFSILHFLCLFGIFLYYIPHAYIVGEKVQKISLSATLIIATILGVFSLLTSAGTRGGLSKTIMWVVLLGLLVCLKEVKTLIIVMAVVSILDELVIVKFRDKYKSAYIANREIDKRGL